MTLDNKFEKFTIATIATVVAFYLGTVFKNPFEKTEKREPIVSQREYTELEARYNKSNAMCIENQDLNDKLESKVTNLEARIDLLQNQNTILARRLSEKAKQVPEFDKYAVKQEPASDTADIKNITNNEKDSYFARLSLVMDPEKYKAASKPGSKIRKNILDMDSETKQMFYQVHQNPLKHVQGFSLTKMQRYNQFTAEVFGEDYLEKYSNEFSNQVDFKRDSPDFVFLFEMSEVVRSLMHSK